MEEEKEKVEEAEAEAAAELENAIAQALNAANVSEDDSGMETWLLIVIIAGSVLFVVAIVVVVICAKKRKAAKLSGSSSTQVRPLPTSTQMTDMGGANLESSPDRDFRGMGKNEAQSNPIMATDENTGIDNGSDFGGKRNRQKHTMSDSSSQPSINMRL